MDEWFEATRQQLEAVAQVIERSVDETIDGVLEASDRIAADLDQAISPALENLDKWETEVAKQVSDWLPDIPAEAVEDFERQVDDWVVSTGASIGEAIRPIEQTVKPVINQHQPCIGCRHYHGEAYGENPEMLVCGIHPFGYEADQCPDWESTWQPDNKG